MIAVVSVSGGKDSTATLLIALERLPKESIYPVFADTGNEHPMTYDYVRYLGEKLGLAIKWVRADFSEWWWQRRDYVRDKWPLPAPKKGWPNGVPADIVARVLAVFEKGPTGNPYLDLCIIKGRFPSRKAQFCTDFLKKQPINKYVNDLVTQHGQVESWQGVRADESESRSKLPERETGGELFMIYRPILRWNVAQVFAKHHESGIEPNPLYKLGMARVGCMPCINVSKDELLEISKRFPDQIDRIEEWEAIVSEASKRGLSTFIPSPEDRGDGMIHDIRNRVVWARTERGGVNLSLFRDEEPESCASRYGLCE
jgi:3'-phosphoadenosine 5'-phosphosulfate sulfotransferase (PAPS reductase)/FAD synthetase